MKRTAFEQLLKSVEQARDHALGKRELRTTVLPPRPAPITGAQVRRIRKRLNASQAVFARYLNVSTKLVQAWESERRTAEGPALILLRLGDRSPEALAAAAFGAGPPPARKKKLERRGADARVRRTAGNIAKSA